MSGKAMKGIFKARIIPNIKGIKSRTKGDFRKYSPNSIIKTKEETKIVIFILQGQILL
jgi:hypothetical protein